VQSLIRIPEVKFADMNNAPVQMACETEQLLTCATPEFIAPTLASHQSYLNPVDYRICVKLQEHVHAAGFMTTPALKSCLIEEWEHFNLMIK